MIIENAEDLSDWLTKYLEPKCDADPIAFAKYVMILLNEDKPEHDLKAICLEQLEVFLQKKTKTFVDSMFETIANKSYVNSVNNSVVTSAQSVIVKSPKCEQTAPSPTDGYQNKDIRNIRNMAEKQRRDKLNGYINDLANSVPLVTDSPKRLDKTSVLRLSAAYLRLNKTALSSSKKTKNRKNILNHWKPNIHINNFWISIIDIIEGFIIVTTGLGKIIYVSHSVENFLGHQNIEMIGNSLTSFLHPSDIDLAQSQIKLAHEQLNQGSQESDRISFQCRIRERNQPRSEIVTYQMVNVSGFMVNTEDQFSEGSVEKADTSILFKGFVQVIPTSPMAELSLIDADLDEYVSRHALDGTLLFADHRISGIIGFLPSEVFGKSAYNFILPEDHSIALFAQKLMFSNSNGTGTIVHRLRTSTGSFVFLQSSGCLQYDKNGQIDHWVCVSRLLVQEEGERNRDKFVKRFTPHIFNISPTALYESLQVVMGPRTLNHPFSTSECVSGVNTNDSNSAKLIEIESSSTVPSPQQPLHKSFNSTTITSFQSSMKARSSSLSTISVQNPYSAQPQQPMTVTSPQTPINSLISNIKCSNVQSVQSAQSTPLVQIQTLPMIPINSTQTSTQQTFQTVKGFENTSSFSDSSSSSGAVSHNVINLISPTPLSLSYTQSNALQNSNLTNEGSVVNPLSSDNLISGQSINVSTEQTHGLAHLLGATVLTFDAQNQPVISVYSPQFIIEEQSTYIDNSLNDRQNNSSDENFLVHKMNTSVDSSDVNPSMDASFYSPGDNNSSEPSNQMLCQQWSTDGPVDSQELTNQSTESSMDFSFPTNGSQCDFGLIEDQLFEVNLLEDPFLSSCATNGDKRSGFPTDEIELDTTVDTQTSMFDFQNTETNSSVVFTPKTKSN